MDSGDPKSNRGWRTRVTFQERSTRADRVSVAVRETRVTGGRSTSGLAAEARAAVEPAIARDPVRPQAAEETRQRTRRDRFSDPLHTVCDSRFVPTRLVGSLRFVTQPTRRLDVIVAFVLRSSLVRMAEPLAREVPPRLRLETRGRSRSPSDAMSADPNALLAFKQLNLKERVRVHVGFRSRRARSPAKNAKCFFPPPAPSSCDRPPIGVARALTDTLPPIIPPPPDRRSSRCTARRSRSARRRSRR